MGGADFFLNPPLTEWKNLCLCYNSQTTKGCQLLCIKVMLKIEFKLNSYTSSLITIYGTNKDMADFRLIRTDYSNISTFFFIYRNGTKGNVIEIDHLNKNSILLMQIIYFCRYTCVRKLSQSFQHCLSPDVTTHRNLTGPQKPTVYVAMLWVSRLPRQNWSHHTKEASVKM